MTKHSEKSVEEKCNHCHAALKLWSYDYAQKSSALAEFILILLLEELEKRNSGS